MKTGWLFRLSSRLLAVGVLTIFLVSPLVGDVIRLGSPEYVMTDVDASGVVLADLDDNGLLDSVAIGSDGRVTVRLANCSGGYDARVTYPYTDGGIPPGATRGVAADFDADGAIDVAVSNTEAGSISVFYGDGTGALGAPMHAPAGAGADHIEAADFDADGYPDLVVANASARTLTFLFSSGSPGVTAPEGGEFVVLDTMESVFELAVGDFDENGLPDVAIAQTFADAIAIAFSISPGVVAAPVEVAPYGPFGLVAGDFDNDGHWDLVAGRPSPTEDLLVLWGFGDGTFEPQSGEDVLGEPIFLTVQIEKGDFNRDGALDFVSRRNDSEQVTLVRGHGDRTFSRTDVFESPNGEFADIALGDSDADGREELFVSSSSDLARITISEGFDLVETLSLPISPGFSELGDFNGDGVLDLVVCAQDAIEFHYGTGNPATPYSPTPTTVAVLGASAGVAVVDFDSNGLDDVVAPYTRPGPTGSMLHIYRSGVPNPLISQPLPQNSATVMVEDLNGDGILDVLVGREDFGFAQFDLSFFAGDGAGGVLPFVSVVNPDAFVDGGAGDLDEDGLIDLILRQGPSLRVRWGTQSSVPGVPSWGPQQVLLSAAFDSTVVDIDQDGYLDVVAATHAGNMVTLIGNGTRLFDPVTSPGLPTILFEEGWGLTDIDGDGNLDQLFTIGLFRNYVFVSRGLGGGSFALAQGFEAPFAVLVHNVHAIPSASGVGQDILVTPDRGFSSAPERIYRYQNLGPRPDCNGNGILDACDERLGTLDCLRFIRGDANQDLAYDLGDAVRTLDVLFAAGIAPCALALDANADGVTDLGDAIYTLTSLFDSGPTPSQPFPSCGSDSTGSVLSCETPACDD